MAKKTLNDKIKITAATFIFFSCLYFVVAIWLKTDGIKFDPDSFYELLKDTLTLAAAFLAPVAAFVLFSDWRDEYYGKKKISDLEDFICAIKNIVESLKDHCTKVEIIEIKASNQFIDLDEYTQLRVEVNEVIEKLHNLADEDKEKLDRDIQRLLNLIDEANTHLYNANFAKNSLRIDYYLMEQGNREDSITMYERMCMQHMGQYRIKFKEVENIKSNVISDIKNMMDSV